MSGLIDVTPLISYSLARIHPNLTYIHITHNAHTDMHGTSLPTVLWNVPPQVIVNEKTHYTESSGAVLWKKRGK